MTTRDRAEPTGHRGRVGRCRGLAGRSPCLRHLRFVAALRTIGLWEVLPSAAIHGWSKLVGVGSSPFETPAIALPIIELCSASSTLSATLRRLRAACGR